MILKKILLLILLLCQLEARSKDHLVAAAFDIHPYGYMNGEKIEGITVDIIKKIEKQSNIKISIKLFPYKRMIQSLESGEVDFSIFFLSNASSKVSDKILPLYDLNTIAIGKSSINLSKYEDLYRYNLVTSRGVHYNTGLKNDRNMKITLVKDYDDAIKMLMDNRSDVIIAPEKILMHQLKRLGLKKSILGKELVLTVNTAWIQFSKRSSHKSLIKRIKESAQRLKTQGEITKSIKKFYSSKHQQIPRPSLLQKNKVRESKSE